MTSVGIFSCAPCFLISGQASPTPSRSDYLPASMRSARAGAQCGPQHASSLSSHSRSSTVARLAPTGQCVARSRAPHGSELSRLSPQWDRPVSRLPVTAGSQSAGFEVRTERPTAARSEDRATCAANPVPRVSEGSAVRGPAARVPAPGVPCPELRIPTARTSPSAYGNAAGGGPRCASAGKWLDRSALTRILR